MPAIHSPRIRKLLNNLEKEKEMRSRTRELLSQINQNPEKWATSKNTINKLRRNLNEYETLNAFSLVREDKATQLNTLEAKNNTTRNENNNIKKLSAELRILGTDESVFKNSENSNIKAKLEAEIQEIDRQLGNREAEKEVLKNKLNTTKTSIEKYIMEPQDSKQTELKRIETDLKSIRNDAYDANDNSYMPLSSADKEYEKSLIRRMKELKKGKSKSSIIQEKLESILQKNNEKILNSSIVVDLSYNKTVLPQTRILTCADLLQNLTILDEVDEFIITVNYRLSSFTAAFGRLAAVITNPTKYLEIVSRMFDNKEDKCGILGGGCLTPSDIARMFLLLNKYLIKRQFRATSQPAMSDEICQMHYVRDKTLPLINEVNTVKYVRRTTPLSEDVTVGPMSVQYANHNDNAITPALTTTNSSRRVNFGGSKKKRTKKKLRRRGRF